MRTMLFTPLLILLACSGKSESPGGGHGGQAESGSAGTNSAGSASSGGGNTAGSANGGGGNTAGSANGGGANTAGSANSGGASSGGTSAASGGKGGQGSGGQELVDCDQRKIVCKIVQPTCPENQVSSVDGSCYGPCVPIESCACSTAQDCPLNDRYTCWQQTHCGPYVR